jgi:hypothetical protein
MTYWKWTKGHSINRPKRNIEYLVTRLRITALAHDKQRDRLK